MSQRLFLLVLALLSPAGARAQADAGVAHAGTAPRPREPAALSNLPITTKDPAAIPWFRLGQKKALNFELQTATEALHKALALDPDFAQALAWLGRCEADATGLAHLERAVALAQKLPETERLSVEALLAERRGDDETVRTLRRKLADLAPNDWLTQLQMGVQAFYDHKSQAAIVFLNRAVALRPELAEPYIYLGYTLALQGDSAAGVRAARRQVELQPDEPNAHDSLGEVLLLVDRVEEAEKAFLHAAELSSDPWMMWMGVAYCRFVRGDFKGAQAAVASGKKSTWRRSDEFATDLVAAWGHWLAGEPDEALAVLDATMRQSEKEKDELRVAWATMERGELLLERGHPDAAREAALAAETRLQRSRLMGDDVNLIKRSLLLLRAAIGLALHDPAESEAAARLLTTELAKAPSNFDLRAEVHFAQGLAALAAGESKRAMQELLVCPLTMPRCRYALAKAQERAGDLTGADDTIAFLLHHPLRDNLHRGEDPAYLVVRARLAGAQAPKQ